MPLNGSEKCQRIYTLVDRFVFIAAYCVQQLELVTEEFLLISSLGRFECRNWVYSQLVMNLWGELYGFMEVCEY